MNNLIKDSLTKLKQKNISNPELDLRILLKYASKKNNEIILSNLNLDNIVELGNVLSEKIFGRLSKSQITVSDLTGVAVQDIKIANSVFKKFMEDKNEI